MKKILIALPLLLFPVIAKADYVDMMEDFGGYGMMGGAGFAGTIFFGFVYLALAAFIFSVIFWLTHNWLAKNKKK